MDAMLMRSNLGLMPADDATREWFSGLKMGASVLAKVSEPRNVGMHRKLFALLRYAFDYWQEMAPVLEYKGLTVSPNFERFRKDIIICAGYCQPVVNIKGEIRLEADSIAFGNMSQERFEKLYSAVIQALLDRVFRDPRWNEEELRRVVDGLLEFM